MLDRPREERTRRFLRRTPAARALAGRAHHRRRKEGSNETTRAVSRARDSSSPASRSRRWGGAASAARGGRGTGRRRSRSCRRCRPNIKQRKRWNIGVKCDAPPFGYINVQGRNAGFDVEIAKLVLALRVRQGRTASASRARTTPAREPALTTGRVDLVIATFTYTPDRDTRIDFSRAYYKATGRLLVRTTRRSSSLSDLAGRTIATTSGSIYDRWVKNCFTSTKLARHRQLHERAARVPRRARGRAHVGRHRACSGSPRPTATSKLTSDMFLALPYGIGIKQGNVALKRWVDSRLELMTQARHVHARSSRTTSRRGLRRVLEEHPQAEATRSATRQGRRDDGVPVAASYADRGAAARRGRSSLPCR